MTSNLLGLVASLSAGIVGAPADSADINAYLAARAKAKDPMRIEFKVPDLLKRGLIDFTNAGYNSNSGEKPVTELNTRAESFSTKLPALDDMRAPQKDDKPLVLTKGWDLDIMAGFMYVPQLAEDKELNKRLNVTIDDFTPALGEDFGNQLQISKQFASLGLMARLTSPWGFTTRDHVTFSLGVEYSSSQIFGKIKSNETYFATLMEGKIKLGDTETLWEQNLNHHVALLAGVGYKLDIVNTKNFDLGFEVSARGGAAYMDFSTLLDLFVIPTEIFEAVGYDVAEALEVHRHKFTVSEGSAWGALGRFEGAFHFNIWKGIALDLGGGYQVEHYPHFRMTVTEYAGGFPDQAIEDYRVTVNPINERDDVGKIDNDINPMNRNGWYVLARLGWKIPNLFGEKEIETSNGPGTMLVPIKYLTPSTSTTTKK